MHADGGVCDSGCRFNFANVHLFHEMQQEDGALAGRKTVHCFPDGRHLLFGHETLFGRSAGVRDKNIGYIGLLFPELEIIGDF